MRGLLRIVLLVMIVHEGLSCGRGKKKGKRRKCIGGPKRCPPEQKQPEQSATDTINNLLGPLDLKEYQPSGDSPGGCDQLSCNADSGCCWSNAVPPTDEFQWVTGSGQPDATKMQSSFNTQTVPDGNFLVTASAGSGDPSRNAQLYSCPISCTGSDITVKVKHWATKGVKLEVCEEQDPGGPLSNCQPLPGGNGNQDSVTVPKGENTRVVIKASGFTEAAGDVVIIDDIEVACDPCATTGAPTEAPAVVTTAGGGPATQAAGTTAPPAVPSTVCADLECDFEGGSLCKYQPGGSASMNWANNQNPFHNRLTGVPKNGQGSKFASSYTKSKTGEKSTMTSKTNFEKEYTIKYKFLKDTDGLALKGCCDDESKCTPAIKEAVEVKDYQAWQSAAFTCQANTKQVMFVCDNTQGKNEGACAVDDIQVYNAASPPESASTRACGGSVAAGAGAGAGS